MNILDIFIEENPNLYTKIRSQLKLDRKLLSKKAIWDQNSQSRI